ncbi:hypothetical protein PAHAL_2G161700 [Panicum hallii]|uniref:Uncharacterized protein n=1 Tax=Panicum hallii TaxID=206008 RepID=A0A2T8KPE1_9POAL|nr:hypothetical protein PAHAL_2G161700 [Panicum hallii]PVH64004.1 hypothetical protein PAHAL_2G161700 [Panicum hallii]PVH64005.1 hypothetical protein PAHAL_2G161700 [Panicum hallii]PVH64009.1 hypothetical protein PAHAL_2G161700 [Panicum hallii]
MASPLRVRARSISSANPSLHPSLCLLARAPRFPSVAGSSSPPRRSSLPPPPPKIALALHPSALFVPSISRTRIPTTRPSSRPRVSLVRPPPSRILHSAAPSPSQAVSCSSAASPSVVISLSRPCICRSSYEIINRLMRSNLYLMNHVLPLKILLTCSP